MEKTYHFTPKGVCSMGMDIVYDDKTMKVISYKSLGGCPGNSLGLGALIVGMEIEEAKNRLRGLKCRAKATSCPDQLSYALEAILSSEAK